MVAEQYIKIKFSEALCYKFSTKCGVELLNDTLCDIG